MSNAALALAGAVGLLALLLLGLHLRSGWRWQVKAAVTLLTFLAVIGLFLALRAWLGLPTRAPLPARFDLHAAVIEEPTGRSPEPGAIFLWVSPKDAEARGRPRAHALPYSRDLHEQLAEAMARMAEGARMEGRAPRAARPGQYRNRQGLELFEAPPPRPPTKTGG